LSSNRVAWNHGAMIPAQRASRAGDGAFAHIEAAPPPLHRRVIPGAPGDAGNDATSTVAAVAGTARLHAGSAQITIAAR
jgi:hypothetical protein